jgi:hypothetical protein
MKRVHTLTKIICESEKLNENKFLEGCPRSGESVLWIGAVDHGGAAARDNRNLRSTRIH